MIDYYGWGSRCLADTSLPGNEWAKEARAVIKAAGMREPGPDSGQIALERDADGKLQIIGRIGANSRAIERRPQSDRRFPKDAILRARGTE